MQHAFPSRQRGFSLIEVLVSMFIVSLGILALAGLMQTSQRYGKTSELRAMATLLANDIADHIRANAGASDPKKGSTSSYALVTAYSATPTLPAAGKACTLADACTPANLASLDLANWLKRVTSMLPGGDAYIDYHPPAAAAPQQSGSFDIWVAWTDPVPAVKNERPDKECPAGLNVQDKPQVRCVYLQAGL